LRASEETQKRFIKNFLPYTLKCVEPDDLSEGGLLGL